jgi:signal transduction histidine kinase
MESPASGWPRHPASRGSVLVACGMAVLSVAVATAVRWALTPLIGDKDPFITYFPAMVVAAWYGGWPGTLVGLTLGTLVAAYFFVPPSNSLLITQAADQRTVAVFGFVGLATGLIGQRQRAAQQRTQAAQARAEAAQTAARHALALRDEVLAAVSHDLRSPITGIRGMAQLLQRRLARLDLDEGPDLLDLLATIDRSLGMMTAMVEELLDLARLEAGRALELDRREVDLVALVRRCATDQTRATPGRRITVTATVAELVGAWDPGRLERVIGNLLSNAVKYSAATEAIEVAVRLGDADQGGSWAELEVRDHGVGIPAADLPHIFERFHRGANVAGRVGGTGIGLAWSRRVVELHGGTIDVDSTVGVGTAVTVRLPSTVSPPSTREPDP